MKRILFQFAAVYGQASAAVLTVTVGLYWLGLPAGVQLCSDFGFNSITTCRASLAVLLMMAFSTSLVLTLYRIRKLNFRQDTDISEREELK